MLTACAAPASSGTAQAAAASASSTATIPVTAAEPPASTPAVADTISAGAECKVDADCEIKNVGNCCGYYPACVGKDTPVDPEAVKAQCQAKGMMGVCGFPAIESCQCNAGKCASSDGGQGGGRRIIPLEQ
ncbi:hypothetical protein [Pseudoxanthomonas dokdonensis]|nr:hypothetical protein [Pseudoxanthomonas dokdonensis]